MSTLPPQEELRKLVRAECDRTSIYKLAERTGVSHDTLWRFTRGLTKELRHSDLTKIMSEFFWDEENDKTHP